MEKICTTGKQLNLFICKNISFQSKFCMLIVISLKNIEKKSFITKCSYADFKMVQRSSSAIIGVFLRRPKGRHSNIALDLQFMQIITNQKYS